MVTISVDEARKTITDIFVRVSVKEEEAALIADMLVDAERRGVHSHGILCTARYVRLIREGKMKSVSEIKVERDNGVVAVWDGCHSSGQILGYRAMADAMEKAKKNGIGCVCVKHANHFGALAYYSQMAQKNGMIGMTFGTGDSTMAPWGGAEKTIGNNPVCVAVPAGKEVSPVLDMAMTTVANGKIANMKRQGKTEIPQGWGLDHDGVPTTKMEDFYTVPPMAGYKGWGMAMIVDVLAGTLFGGGTGDRAKDFSEGPSLMMIAFNIGAFSDENTYFSAVDSRIQELKATRLAKGSEEILMPGEIEDRFYRESEKTNTMAVLKENLDMVNELASELGLKQITVL